MQRRLLAMLVLAASPAWGEPPAFSKAETAAIYTAAGFSVKGDQVSGCDAADPSWPRSSFFVEAVDLNGDGKPEAIVSEGNTACYGMMEQAFTLLAREPDGSWRKLASERGVTLVLETKTGGWRDIEYGGPGFEKPPVLRWDGKAYR